MNTATASHELSAESYDAFVFDLDGVITRTAKVHAEAWKAMFDDYLEKHTAAGEAFEPFDIARDYRRYVDGKPRYQGVESFLKSRAIELPYGDPDDDPGQETICGLGNRKNRLFRDKLRSDGVEVYETSLRLIHALREAGVPTAVVSSSRNCQAVLEAAGITDLFDARVDGTDLQRLDLKGKPAPDMFLEASRRLGSDPQRTVALEDAEAGVQAAKAAGFGCVIGVDRDGQADALLDHGADRVVADLGELHLATAADDSRRDRHLPSALDRLDEIVPGEDQQLALFLDYDGTLSPIVSHPDDAILSDSMHTALQQLATVCRLAIISGRDLADVRQRVGIEDIWYAGSHGFDIAGPGGQRNEYQQGAEYLPLLDDVEQILRNKLSGIAGCLVERKRFSIATHYRQVADDEVETVKHRVEETHAEHPRLRLSRGKKILELQPDIDWDKGKALRWLMQAMDMDSGRFRPVYIGDDVTDEDAFRELESDGIGILVAESDQPTRATYRLADPHAVEAFLERLARRLGDQ